MPNLRIEDLSKGKEKRRIKEMEETTAQTAVGKYMVTPQIVCFADGVGNPIIEDNPNMSPRDKIVPLIKIRDIKENLPHEGLLRDGRVVLMTR